MKHLEIILAGIAAKAHQEAVTRIIKATVELDLKGMIIQEHPTNSPEIIRACGCKDFNSPFPQPQTEKSSLISNLACRDKISRIVILCLIYCKPQLVQ